MFLKLFFCVFSSAVPVSVFVVYGLAGSLNSQSAPELFFCLSLPFFLEAWTCVRQCNSKQMLTLGSSWAPHFLSHCTCYPLANLLSLLSKYFRTCPLPNQHQVWQEYFCWCPNESPLLPLHPPRWSRPGILSDQSDRTTHFSVQNPAMLPRSKRKPKSLQ